MNEISLRSQKTKKKTLPFFDRMAKKSILSLLKNIRHGHLIVIDKDETYHFGVPAINAPIIAKIEVHDFRVYRHVLRKGVLGSGESYIDHYWSSPNIVNVIQIMVKNLQFLTTLESKHSISKYIPNQLFKLLTLNTTSGSKKNIASHYDLGNDFFKLFLDETMMYSSAIFNTQTKDLYQASNNKLRIICEKLELTASDHVIEIGTGWGGFALYAAQQYGCRVTTTTISKRQYQFTCQKVKEASLENKITVLLKDYRELTGKYDKLVSIEMIEAVGHQYYASYFSKCNQLLQDNGLMLIQGITIPDQRYQSARRRVDFIKRYIFPGGCLPSNQIFCQHLTQCTDMQLVDLEDITSHYAQTLAIWREQFLRHIHTVKRQGFDDQFIRMWDFYLAYCEGGFRERVINTAHFLCAKPNYRFKSYDL